MQIDLIRYCYGPDETLGLLKFKDYALWTVECPWQNNQRFTSCIPDGQYALSAFDSPAHRDSWQIIDVDGRDGILIHSGNSVMDVTGCISPGLTRSGTSVWNSFDAMRLMNEQIDREEPHIIRIGQGGGAIMAPREQPTEPEKVGGTD